MNEIRVKLFLEARTLAVLIGLAIGLGIALHEAFFFVALLIALVAGIEWAIQATAEHQHVRHLKASVRADSSRPQEMHGISQLLRSRNLICPEEWKHEDASYASAHQRQ